MSFLLLVPTILSFLIFAAHLLRNGALILVPFVVLALALLVVRSPCVARFFQLALVAIALQWLVATFVLAGRRLADGQPWARMALILIGVALFALAAALLFEARPLRRRYPRRALV